MISQTPANEKAATRSSSHTTVIQFKLLINITTNCLSISLTELILNLKHKMTVIFYIFVCLFLCLITIQ